MSLIVWNIILLLACTPFSESKKSHASYIKLCSKSSPNFDECCLEHGKEALPYMLAGDKEYKLPKMTPYLIPLLTMDGGGLKIEVKNLYVYGLENHELKKVKFDFDKRTVIVKLLFKKLVVLGDFTLDGRILLLQLRGTGKSNFTAEKVDIEYNVNYKFFTKEGEEYFTVDKADSDITCEQVYIDITNIFGDNKLLGETTNKAMNDNWREFLEAFKPVLTQTITEIGNSIINGFGTTVPFADIFLD